MTIKKITESDIKQVVTLHLDCLPETTSSKIGKEYLQKLYNVILSTPKLHLSLVAIHNKNVVGSITGTSDLKNTQKLLKKSFSPKTYLVILKSILKRKITIFELIKRTNFEKKLETLFEQPYYLILTLFVSKEFRRQKVGKKLIEEFVNISQNTTSNYYVDTLENNRIAQKFYQKIGFKKLRLLDNSVVFGKRSSKF